MDDSVPEPDSVWLTVCVGVGVGEQTVLMPASHAPRYGSVDVHEPPPSDEDQLPYTEAAPASGK